MKTYSRTLWFIVSLIGCAWQTSAQTTTQEQEDAKKEISEVIGTIFRNLQNLDAEALYQSYAETSDFIQITTAGELVNYQTARTEHKNWFMTLSSLKVTPVSEAYRFLPGNTVIYSWYGKFEVTTKRGVHLKADKFGITFILSKIDNQWKVIYQQASSLPPVPVKE